MIVEICPAKSTSAAVVAVVDGDNLDCETFTATLRDPIKPVSPATTVKLKATDKTVTVVHQDQNSAMASGEDLLLARHSDGYWFVIVWIC